MTKTFSVPTKIILSVTAGDKSCNLKYLKEFLSQIFAFFVWGSASIPKNLPYVSINKHPGDYHDICNQDSIVRPQAQTLPYAKEYLSQIFCFFAWELLTSEKNLYYMFIHLHIGDY